jgi:hypothetical protein
MDGPFLSIFLYFILHTFFTSRPLFLTYGIYNYYCYYYIYINFNLNAIAYYKLNHNLL